MTQDEEKAVIRKAKELFRVGHYEVCEALLEGVQQRGGWKHHERGEEGGWLYGLVLKRDGRYREAAKQFGDSLQCSINLFNSGARRAPTRICMESLKGRGTCSLYLYDYASAIRDFKEWLRLRGIFSPTDTDPTSAFYNLGLCYKHTSVFSAAEHFFSLAQASANMGGKYEEANRTRAEGARALVAECVAVREETLRKALADLTATPDKEGPAGEFVSELLVFRTKLHFYLARSSYQVLMSNIENSARGGKGGGKRPKWSFVPSRWMGDYAGAAAMRSSGTNPRQVILDVSTRCLTRLLKQPEKYIRKYLDNPSQSFPLGESIQLEPASKQCLNFACEFVMNHATLHAWRSVQLDDDSVERMKNIDEFSPSLPFLGAVAIKGGGIIVTSPPDPPQISFKPAEGAIPTVIRDWSESLSPQFTEDMEVVEFEDQYNADTLTRNGMYTARSAVHMPEVFGLGKEKPLMSPRERMLLARQLPVRHCAQNWNLVFGTRVHGFCLTALLRNAEDIGPNLIVVETLDGSVMGGYSALSWEPQQYPYGNGETLVFTVGRSQADVDNEGAVSGVRTWGWSGKNRFFVQCDQEHIAFGGGQSVALSIEGDTLMKGRTGPCDTFGSPSLCEERCFTIKAVECWSFDDEC